MYGVIYSETAIRERAKGGSEPPPSLPLLCLLAARLAASAIGVPASEISLSRRSTRRVSAARQLGIYLAHTAAGLPLAKVAEFFGRDRTTAAHACRLIEDRRDDRSFDAELNELEELLRMFCGGVR